jgi:hypothetical protein
MFVMLGLWLLLPKAAITKEEKKNYRNHDNKKRRNPKSAPTVKKGLPYIKIAFGSLCLALSVGCRPTFLLASVLVPFILWRYVTKRKTKEILSLLASVALPYIAVAIPLMWYNYARFGSVLDFGTYYVYNFPNTSQLTNMNPMGLIDVFLVGIKNIFFAPISFVAGFPFLSNSGTLLLGSEYPLRFYWSNAGLINFPLMWVFAALPLLRSQLKSESKRLVITCGIMLLMGVFISCYMVTTAGMCIRYQIDYMWLFLFPSLLCAYRLWERFGRNSAFAKALCFACMISAAIAMSLPSEATPFLTLKPEVHQALKELFVPFW